MHAVIVFIVGVLLAVHQVDGGKRDTEDKDHESVQVYIIYYTGDWDPSHQSRWGDVTYYGDNGAPPPTSSIYISNLSYLSRY